MELPWTALTSALAEGGVSNRAERWVVRPVLLSALLLQAERRMVDQFTFGFTSIERQGLNELRRAVAHTKFRKCPEAEPAVVTGVSDEGRTFAACPQPQDRLGHKSTADPLAVPRGQNCKRADQAPSGHNPDPGIGRSQITDHFTPVFSYKG